MSENMKYGPLKESECTAEEWDNLSKANEARERASKMATELESMGATVEVANARLDHLLLALVRLGMLDAGEYVDIVLDCNKGIESQLQSLLARRREQVAEFQRQQREAYKAELKKASQGPGAKQLIVPQEKRIIKPPGV